MAARVTLRSRSDTPRLRSLRNVVTEKAQEIHRTMAEVVVYDDESFERAIRRFKKKCEKAGILSDLRKHRHYEKPSERRKRKLNAARRKRHHPHR